MGCTRNGLALESVAVFCYHNAPMETLSLRQQTILNRVVELYIETAQPVGSRAITVLFRDLYADSYSPATVRYEMGQLESVGYLTHPHISAGRVPTDKGYRFYLDHGLKGETVSQEVFGEVGREISNAAREEQILGETISTILAALTSQMSVVAISDSAPSLLTSALIRLYLKGTHRLLEYPEFHDVRKVRGLLSHIDETTAFARWLDERCMESPGISVTIGNENKLSVFQDCTVISASCRMSNRRRAMLALIGPRRMRYARTIPLINRLRETIEQALERVLRSPVDA